MRAVVVKKPGGVDQLAFDEVPTPRPGRGELLVRVRAAALNRAGILQREGNYPPPPGASEILGLDMAGVVESAGSGCARFEPGDRVFGLLPGGGYAEYAVIPEAMAMPVPEGFTFEQAAAVPEVFLTAFQTLFWIGGLESGERVLIHSGGGGVGTAAIQLAAGSGASVLTTTGTDEKCESCRALGAERAINYRSQDFAGAVMEHTGGEGVDLILDFVAAPYWERNISVLRTDGRLVLISLMGGTIAERVDLGTILRKRIQVNGTTLRARSPDYKIRLTRAFAESGLDELAAGRLKPVIDTVFSWTRVADAHTRMEANLNTGKIVLTID
jgi:putative PIG3 family NAD(P)H quinone oxidoreductase